MFRHNLKNQNKITRNPQYRHHCVTQFLLLSLLKLQEIKQILVIQINIANLLYYKEFTFTVLKKLQKEMCVGFVLLFIELSFTM